ncbi:hypothetical protein ACOTB6_30245 [Achromobacter xylosoxidans]
MDFDWKTMVEGVHTALESTREMWLALTPAQQKKIGGAVTLGAALLALLLPAALMAWWGRRSKKRQSDLTGNQIAHVHAAQAVDLWYQESRRYLDARTAALKSIATGAGLGLAAAGTILAIAEAPRIMLYSAAALHFLSFLVGITAQAASTSIYRAQANEFSKHVAGADPEEIVAFELIRPANAPKSRTAAIGYSLALMWMAAGWLFILTAVMMMSAP